MTSPTAPGNPGIVPRWTSSAKIGVGTAMSSDSNVWFTISHGIINEVYFPRIDIANIRDWGFIVTNGTDFFSEEKRSTKHEYELIHDGIPAYHLTSTCEKGRYSIVKRIITDPRRNVLLQEVEFIPLQGSLSDYHLYTLVAPHLFNEGAKNNAWVGRYKGQKMLFAEHRGITLACACSTPFLEMTCGYVGVSDAWQDIHQNKRLTRCYTYATDGNVALAGEIDLQACGGKFVLALGFGQHTEEAGIQTRGALFRHFDCVLAEYLQSWKDVQDSFRDLSTVDQEGGKIFRMSTAVLKIHDGKHYSGSVIASLSIPWGFSKGDNDLGGYHLIWPRDQVQTAEALIAAHNLDEARQALIFLMCTQEADGHWVQCMWEDGTPYWYGLQMDETASPILLAEHLYRHQGLEGLDPTSMIEKAASFIIENGPVTQQDRWEEEAGYTAFTLATQIAALLVAADFLDRANKFTEAQYLRETADWWNDNIEEWLYVKDTALAKQYEVEGYYVRVTPFTRLEAHPPVDKKIILKNLPASENVAEYTDIVSVDALALVRYGLRDPNDPKILNTIKLIDGMLKCDTVKGPAWHRYNRDGYGEHEDGSPFDGTGKGRAWPLLNGERAHYELAKGNREGALELLRSMANFAGEGGLLPEQVWDSADIPERSLYNGHSAGSAKPLVWAHAEYLMLLRSLQENQVFNMPPQTVERYITNKTKSTTALWRFDHKCFFIPQGKKLRLQAHNPSIVRWSTDGWTTHVDLTLQGNSLNVYFVDLPTEALPIGTSVFFTFYWTEFQKWEGVNYYVKIS